MWSVLCHVLFHCTCCVFVWHCCSLCVHVALIAKFCAMLLCVMWIILCVVFAVTLGVPFTVSLCVLSSCLFLCMCVHFVCLFVCTVFPTCVAVCRRLSGRDPVYLQPTSVGQRVDCAYYYRKPPLMLLLLLSLLLLCCNSATAAFVLHFTVFYNVPCCYFCCCLFCFCIPTLSSLVPP